MKILHFVIHSILLYLDIFERRSFRDLVWQYFYLYWYIAITINKCKHQDMFKIFVYYCISDDFSELKTGER